MSGRKLWYILTVLAFAMLPLAGCGGTSGTSASSKDGYTFNASGKVAGGKSSLKTLFAAATDLGTVTVINAQDGTTLATGPIDANGKFSNLAITLPTAKTILVFKAVVSLAGSPFRAIVPIDLSNPPAAGISASNSINISIGQESTNTAVAVSAMLGVTGVLGDTGATLGTKTFADVADQVVKNGGQVLAYNTSGLQLTGSLSNSALLPAKAASTFTFDDLNNIKLDAEVISAYIPANKAIVNFKITDKASGKGVTGLRNINLNLSQLQPEIDGSNSYWLAYRATSTTDYGMRPNFEQVTSFKSDGSVNVQGMTIIDHGDGTYTATFATDVTAPTATNVTYNANLVHRIGLTVQSVAVPGGYAGPVNPKTGAVSANFSTLGVALAVYDFVPATGEKQAALARDIVTTAACNKCHYALGLFFGHAGRRADTRLCVTCHTTQLSSVPANGNSEGEFVTLMHKIHMGEELPTTETPYGMGLNEIKFPMDVRNCTVCHNGADANNWKAKPSRKACGSCHTNVAFAAGTNHPNAQATDNSCAGCHADASLLHVTMESTPNNPSRPTGVDSFSYQLTEVTIVDAHPVIKFKPVINGAALTFNTYVDATTEMVAGYTAGPSLYVAYARPQDGITAPADFNVSANAALKTIWAGTASATTNSLSGPVGGVYTATLNAITIPADATMVTGAIMSNGFALVGAEGIVNRDLNGDGDKLDNYTVKYQAVSKVATGYTARRVLVSNAKCNACHEQLGTKPSFHSGTRNDATTCSICHHVNRANRGWPVYSASFVHSLHAAKKLTVPYTWHKAVDATTGAVTWTGETVTYPGVLRNCEQCHVSNFDYAGTAAVTDKMQYVAVAYGTYAVDVPPAGVDPLYRTSPSVTTGVDYGTAYSGSNAAIAPVEASAATLVSSPISAACFSCHDTKLARAHIALNGGSIAEARSTALAKKETCLICHGTAQNTLNEVVPTIKAVHRWW